ncbi:diguanylate cyclase [Lachnobacterium bovis]|uniref:diguanylate cyclase n=1 Tax=Lachnobacterium bovis TaxID=140626 RepID=UPI0015A690F7|nr:diguanylate cyclase [Lachnobacterium bovis]
MKKIEDHRKKKQIFYKEAKEEIAQRNLLTLRTISIIVTFLILFLITFTPLLLKTWKITIQYIVFAPIAAIFAIMAIIAISEEVKSPKVINTMCMIFEIVIMGFIMVIDIFPYPDSQCTFTPLALTVASTLFIFPAQYEFLFLSLSEIVFIYLTVNQKHDFVARNDIFASLVGFFVACVLYNLFTKIHLSYYLVKEQYIKVSQRDELTGTLNNIVCENKMREYLRLKDDKDTVALICINLDYFKKANEILGKNVCDNILRKFGKLLKKTFADNAIIGRNKGDEFIVLMQNVENEKDIEIKCSKIKEGLEEMSNIELNVQLTCSIGIVSTADKFYSYYDLKGIAMDALYIAKNHGRNRIIFRNPKNIDYNSQKKRFIIVAHDKEAEFKEIRNKFGDSADVLWAKNGKDAVEQLSLYSRRISAFILNMNFEDYDGYDILHFMKTRIYTKKIPVLVLAKDEKTVDKAMLYGADEASYFPIDTTDIKLKADQIMHNNV